MNLANWTRFVRNVGPLVRWGGLSGWEAIRKQGRRRFIWRFGIVAFGLPVGVLGSTLAQWWRHDWSASFLTTAQFWLNLPINALIGMVIGFLFGAFEWRTAERRFWAALGRSAQSPSDSDSR